MGLFGPRYLHKHLWKLPIPEFDETKRMHSNIAKAGAAAAAATQIRLDIVRELQERQGDELTVALARRELRKWLRTSDEGKVAHLHRPTRGGPPAVGATTSRSSGYTLRAQHSA